MFNRVARLSAALILAIMTCALADAQAAKAPLAPSSTIALIPGGNLSEAENDPRVLRAMIEALRLLGHKALEPAAVRKRLQQAGAPELCASLSGCDRAKLLKTLAVDAVVIYSLWYEDEKPDEFAVELTRFETQGQASQEIGTRDLKAVVQAVLAQALADAESARTTSLAIESVPEAAAISIDGRAFGKAPVAAVVRPGRHQVKAELEGYVSVLDYVEVGKLDLVVHYTARLSRTDEAPGSGSHAGALATSSGGPNPEPAGALERRPSPLNYIFGGVLTAASIGLLAYGIVSATSDGECDRRDAASRCVVIKNGSTRAIWSLAGAGLGAAGAACFFVLQPIVTRTRAGSDVGLQLSGTY